jgi:microcystin-dependent protein
MATIDTYDLPTTQDIIDNTIVNGSVNGTGDLILTKRNTTTFNAGSVKAPQGDQGPERPLVAGRITLYAGTAAPSGWAFCDGSAVSRVNFPALFAAIGTIYGAGDGSTTFNLPDLKGRVPLGFDASQTDFNALGKQGGEKTHVLTEAELPSHTHTVLGYSNIDDRNFTGNVGRMNAADTYGQNNTTYDKPTGAAGGGQAHNNLQPYGVMNYIIALGTKGPQGGGVAAPRYYTRSDVGTTTQRDVKYGVPGTAAARVALANQQITWYNTDLGWKERYYEADATSGLTVMGLIGAPAGWYPISDGPFIELEAVAEVSNFIDTLITGWSIRGRKGGASWFTMTGTDRVNVLKWGRYDVKVFTNQYGGNTSVPDYVLQLLATDNSTVLKVVGGGAFTKNVSFMTRPHQELYDVVIQPNQKIGWKLQRGTLPAGDTNMQVHTGSPDVIRGRMQIRYVGPPLNDIQL